MASKTHGSRYRHAHAILTPYSIPMIQPWLSAVFATVLCPSDRRRLALPALERSRACAFPGLIYREFTAGTSLPLGLSRLLSKPSCTTVGKTSHIQQYSVPGPCWLRDQRRPQGTTMLTTCRCRAAEAQQAPQRRCRRLLHRRLGPSAADLHELGALSPWRSHRRDENNQTWASIWKKGAERGGAVRRGLAPLS